MVCKGTDSLVYIPNFLRPNALFRQLRNLIYNNMSKHMFLLCDIYSKLAKQYRYEFKPSWQLISKQPGVLEPAVHV